MRKAGQRLLDVGRVGRLQESGLKSFGAAW